MTLLLKQLDIHGFKSFATPTTFVFDRGITAVIGPNGSGKSNVAEALRWVLGEQGYSNLRSRRTEDVIFAGSDKRAQLSMAEVVLTLDNRDGELPIPYGEITVTRRAFRSGESQYLINGSRVRLKDVQQLVAPLGQSYTIIGQGLVDAALSQRPEERRGLFEHAAGISGLRLRANEAERSLAESSANAQRLRDILSELEPRVRSLERSARLAREYGTVRDRLVSLQRLFYGHLWATSCGKLAAMRSLLHDAERAHEEAEQLHVQASHALGRLRADERRLADALRTITEAVNQNERLLDEARHRRALLDARIRSAAERIQDLQCRIDELDREQTEMIDEAERHDTSADSLRATICSIEERLSVHDATVDAARRRRAELRAALESSNERSIAISRELAESEGALNAMAERRVALAADRERVTAQSASERSRIAEMQAELERLERHASEFRSQIESAQTTIGAHNTSIQSLIETVNARRQSLEAVERELTSLQARLDVLERSHASGEGFYAGVRAVLRAVNRRELVLPGLVGTVAETIEVPKELETAIEVALGGHLQDLIVASWDDAQHAIDFLRRSNSGRATFQPLDTVRSTRRPALNVRDRDLIGVAADLVTFPERVAVVVEQILGRTLVATDLDASRRILQSAPGWTLVTLTGEITRPSGSVTGGGRAAEAGLLGRERERRSLPKSLAATSAKRATLVEELDHDAGSVRDRELKLQRVKSECDALRMKLRETMSDHERLTHALRDAESASAKSHEYVSALDQRALELQNAEDAIINKRTSLEAEQNEVRAEHDRLEAALSAETDDIDAVAAGLRAELATMRERLNTTGAAATRARARAAEARKAAESRSVEMTRLTQASDAADRDRATIDAEIQSLERRLAESQAAVPPVTADRDEITRSLASAERGLNRAADALREAERERDRASLNLARIQDEQVFLTERIRGDLEIDDPTTLEPAGENDEIPDEQEIVRLRERLRRMSNVGEDVLEQHETESQRLTFLSGQLTDVDEASDGLRRVLTELNGKMTARFTDTFRDVAVAFEQTFTRLFGGGTARLVMNAAEDGAAGIDIVAQPPGKRLQNLTALSGGERTLTAVALLIAIQRVNPSPFCLLDEVDAALDESNVVRFRDELRDLAGATQYVVITHNRGTIEGADILYGVTMGDDGVSRVLSLRLEEAIRAVDEYETVQVTGN